MTPSFFYHRQTFSSDFELPKRLVNKKVKSPEQATKASKNEQREFEKGKAEFNKRKESIGTYERIKEGRRGKRLESAVSHLRDGKEKKSRWEKREVYHNTLDTFDAATSGALSGKTFESLYTVNGEYNHQKARESKELFFAIIAEKTEGFQNELGEMFSNSAQENIEKFPFMYHMWMEAKSEGFDKALKAIERETKNKERNIKAPLKSILKKVGSSAGISYEPIHIADSSKEKAEILHGYIQTLRQKANQNPDDHPHTKLWKETAEELASTHFALLVTRGRRENMMLQKEKLDQSFTRTELTKPQNRRLVMEIAMKKFQKAVEMVDTPLGGSNWQERYAPPVRRLLIASIFERGVGAFRVDEHGNEYYEEKLNERNNWMLEAVSSSHYFDTNVPGKEIDENRQVALEVAYIGGQVARELEESKEALDLIGRMIKIKNETDPAKRETLEEAVARDYSADQVRMYDHDLDWLENQEATILGDNEKRKELLITAERFLKNPQSKESQAWFDALDENGDGFIDAGKSDYFAPDQLSRFGDKMQSIQMAYKMIDMQEKNSAQYLDLLGLNTTDMYRNYVNEIVKNPDLHIDNWADYFTGKKPGGTKVLAEFLNRIMPNSKTGIKEDFLAVLANYDQPVPEGPESQQIRKHRMAAKEILGTIKMHLYHQEQILAAKDRKMPEIEKKLKGMSIGDQASAYVKRVWSMTFAPGQSIANRIAGGVALYTALKLIRKGIRGEGKIGKMAMVAGLAFTAEMITKETTGEGLLERMGLNTIGEAAEGTHEEALAQYSEKSMEDLGISKEEHLRAQFALNQAPFHKVMEWYDKTNPNGAAYKPERSGEDELALFDALNIDTGNIVKGVQNRDKKDIRARYILRETVERFFEYVAEKEGKSEDETRKGIQEFWVDGTKNPDQVKHRDFAFVGSRADLEKLRWQDVVEAEVTAHMVEETKGKNGTAPAMEAVSEWGSDMAEWLRENVVNPGDGYAEIFFLKLGDSADEVKGYLDQLAETAGLKYHFGKESIKFWYKNNEWELKRFGENTWKLFTTGVTLPFKAAYAGLDFAMPWTLTKLNQITEILRSDKLVTTKAGALYEADIVEPGAYVDGVLSNDPEMNPEFAYFGNFQQYFLAAQRSQEHYAVDWDKQIGYHITSIDHDLSDINTNNPTYESPGNRYNKMEAKSREEAIQFFVNKGLPKEDVNKYMEAIHTVIRENPEQVYTFWRMPLEGSAEYKLRELNRWTDGPANSWKDREPIIFQPNESGWEQAQKAFGIKSDTARVLVGEVGKYGVQLPRLWFGAAEKLGFVIQKVAEKISKEDEPWVGEMTKLEPASDQFLDEAFTNASETHLAMSDFYQGDKSRSMMYRLALGYARKNGQDLYLGFFEGEQGYEGRAYLKKPEGHNYNSLEAYYKTTWKKDGNPDIPKFQHFIDQGKKNDATR